MSSSANAHGAAADDVVLSGLSGRLPDSDSIEEFARQLFAGKDLVTTDGRRWTPGVYGLPKRLGSLKELAHFDASYFGVHAKQAHVMDPQLRLLLELTHEAVVDAGYSPAELRGSRTGVYVGQVGSETKEMWCKNVDKLNGYVLTGCISSMFSNWISCAFDFKGPSISIDTACSSSMHALVEATTAIRAGHIDAAIVAGANLCLDPVNSVSFQRLTLLSTEGRCAAFDVNGNGYVRSEAVVAVLLQRRRDARRLYCTVRGARINNDGSKTKGISYPSGDMQRRLAQETFQEARLRPKDVVYVEAHGTGTKVGDPEEVNAIAELFCKDRQTPLLIGSVKSNMGHAEPASGLCSVAKVVLAMERGVIPANLHFKQPNPNIPALIDGRLKVVVENTPWQGGLVAVNSLGVGGANAHVILESQAGARAPAAEYPAPRLVLASGRTDEAVERLLRLAAEHQRDAELHALLDAVHARAIPRHPHRGYAVLDPARGAQPVTEVLEEGEGEPRPLWFVFGGMGSQWAGMARSLLRLPAFAASIARSAAALAPHGLDLRYVIAEAPEADFSNIIYSFVSIAAVQVALVDVLRELGLRPDGIIGHSLGEIGCAYADDTLTGEQAVLCAYWRGRCTLDAAPAPGAMAAVGLSWEEAARRCPADIDRACHNSNDNVTISGPLVSMTRFLEEQSADGVFVRKVNTSGVAFHSRYIAAVAPLLRARLQEVLPEPRPRSPRWLSTSIPQEQWDSDLAKLSDAAYHVNNFVSPVRFAAVMPLVPARALLVEVSPDALLQALLKRALPLVCHVPLVRRDAPDALAHLLAAVGKAYAAGAQPQVARLYPAVSWPVSRGTPALASHVGWDHSVQWSVADFRTARCSAEHHIEVDLGNADDSFLAGHDIDGGLLFPATGYLMLVWRSIAKLNNLTTEEAAIVLENVEFRRSTIVSRDVPLQFLVTLLRGTGEFEVCEGGAVVVTGTARLARDAAAEHVCTALLDESASEEEYLLPLDSEDIYKDLRLRGYNYKGVFRGIRSSDARGKCGLLNWEGNWIAFLDAMIQFDLIGANTRDLYLPTRLQRVVIDPSAQRLAVTDTATAGGAIPVKLYRNLNVIVAGGVEFRGLRMSQVPRRANAQAPILEKYVFLPLESAHFDAEDPERSKRHALTAVLQLALENCGALTLKLGEHAHAQQPAADALLLLSAMQVLGAEPAVRVEATLVAGDAAPQYAAAMVPLGVQVSNKKLESGCGGAEWHVALGVDVLARHDAGALGALSARARFVLLQEPPRAVTRPAALTLLAAAGLTLVSRACATSCEYVLLRRAVGVPGATVVVEARDDDFAWVEQLKHAMKRAESEDMRVFVWSRAPGCGVQGLATCLRREPGGERLRLYCLPGAEHAFSPDAPAYSAQAQYDLAFNVLRDGVWGTFRHLPLDDVADTRVQVEHAYVNTLTRGDLSSLRWVQSELHAAAALRPRTALCRVYYAALNFRDVMLATARLPPDALETSLAGKECILGMEFSGRSSSGKRVMGKTSAKALATTVVPDEVTTWEVPAHWSLEEAATVPVAYLTAYYALAVRGRMRRGESVLVHAGAGGVGQAAIAIALHAGCTVFTTVGSPDKRAFLRERFPQLPDANIGNSRDCSFEQLVLQRTRGRGVDLVLNSLAGDQLQASLRCVARRGRFLEIGKLDLSVNTAPGMAVLLKNVTVHGVLLDDLFDGLDEHPDRKKVTRCFAEGIAAGVVRPLPATVYAADRLEEAFRYMATGKHIGKVLIRVREEETSGEPAPAKLQSAVPRTYMHPGKSYVLVGGLGGFGLELGEWLTDRGARTLVFNSRSGVRTGYQGQCIRRWRARGVRVLVSRADAATAAGARALLREAAAAAPVGGIYNLAVVLHNALLENQTPDSFGAVARPKIDVTRFLDSASRELAPELEQFVAFSSVSCGRGNVGQSNYGLANSAMERLCEQRRAAGLPALAVQWGAVGDVGLVAAMRGGEDAAVSGTMPQRIASCLATLGALLAAPHAVASSLVLADKHRAEDKPKQDLVQAVANILGISDLKKVSQTATLAELGMDSLMGAEIKETLEREYDMPLAVHEVRALTFRSLRGVCGESAPARAGGESAPARAGGESAPARAGGESAPARAGGESAPARAGGESAHARAGGESAPARAGGESAPARAGGESAPARAGGESAPARAGGESAPARAGGESALPRLPALHELVPRQVLVALPSQAPARPDERAVFMVHAIEGTAQSLRGVAALVRGAVWGLQCAGAAPLADMAALARFYVTHVRAAQPQPPYTLLGYSFGAAVAFEMALQLERDGCAVRLVLVDGSPAFISSYFTRGRESATRTLHSDEADALAFFGRAFYRLDSAKEKEMARSLERLPDWEARVSVATELLVALGAEVDSGSLRVAALSFLRRLALAEHYQPAARLQGPVTLFRARDGDAALDEHYGLRAVCAGELRTRRLACTHHTIVSGDAARTIADHVSGLLELR